AGPCGPDGSPARKGGDRPGACDHGRGSAAPGEGRPRPGGPGDGTRREPEEPRTLRQAVARRDPRRVAYEDAALARSIVAPAGALLPALSASPEWLRCHRGPRPLRGTAGPAASQ